MAILLRWWRSLLDVISLHTGDSDRWVEPANDITRAILSGQPLWLPALTENIAAASEVTVVVDGPAEAVGPVLPEVAAAVEMDEAAAEETREAPAARPRRRRGRRAA